MEQEEFIYILEQSQRSRLTGIFAMGVYAGSWITVFSIFVAVFYRVGRAGPDWKLKNKKITTYFPSCA